MRQIKIRVELSWSRSSA